MQLTDFRMMDQNTGADLHKLKVYRENLLEISGSLTTIVPVTASSFTINIRLNLNGKLDWLGMPITLNQPVDCPDSLTASSSDPKQWYVHHDIDLVNISSSVHFVHVQGRYNPILLFALDTVCAFLHS